MITGLHHVQITIPEGAEDRAREFYCGTLGLEEVSKPNSLRGRGGIWVAAGAHQIHIGTESGVNRNASKAHVAYEVDNIQPWREKLESHGVKILEGVPISGFERFEFRDPFGNRVEMIQCVSDE